MSASRHDRQERLDGVGAFGQRELRDARVLVVGLGGLGCPAALCLAGAGVGNLTLVDRDLVELTNLHRQTLYAQADVEKPKANVAQRRLLALDPSLDVVAKALELTPANATSLVAGHDVVLDCTDDLEAKLALARACAGAAIPLVHAAAVAWDGLVGVFDPPATPCYFCAFPDPVPGGSCAVEGIWAPLVGRLGTMQAEEALKLLLDLPSPLRGALHLVDARAGTSRTITLKKRPGCDCSMSKTAHDLPPEGAPVACPLPWAAPDVPVVLADALKGHEREVFLLDVREPDEHEEVAIPGSYLIPLGSLQRRLDEVPKDRQVVVYCAVGGRSARATHFLRGHGVEAVNLHGGIRTWLALQ